MDHLARAIVLLEQERYEHAEPELRQALASEPESSTVHALLATCLKHKRELDEALSFARKSVALAPDESGSHTVLAEVLFEREDYPEAMTALQEALRLAPDDAGLHVMLAGLLLRKRDREEALQAVNRALELDPELPAAHSMRAAVLSQAGQGEKGLEATESALAEDPEDESAHLVRGYVLLDLAKYDEAADHFKEALRLDPACEAAKDGIALILKAKNPVYRLYLRYSAWTEKLSGRALWGFVIGAYLLFRVLRALSRNNPDLAPYVTPLLLVYLAFVLFTWTSEPIFNSLLRFDKLGRYMLAERQIAASNWFVGLIAAGAVLFGAGLASGSTALVIGGGLAAAMSIPAATLLGQDSAVARRKLTPVIALLGVLAVWAAVTAAPLPLGLFALGFLGFSFYATKVALDYS